MSALVEELFSALKQRGIMMSSAESCTGGMIAKTITDEPGSSAVFERGFVTYSNQAKEELLAVPYETLEEYGAVSAEVAKAMAQGALEHSHTKVAVSCTGVAGPGGGTAEKPVGLVYIGVASASGFIDAYAHNFEGERDSIRQQTVEAAIKHIMEAL